MHIHVNLVAAAAILVALSAPGALWAQATTEPATPAENEAAPAPEAGADGATTETPADAAAEPATPAENEAAPAPEAGADGATTQTPANAAAEPATPAGNEAAPTPEAGAATGAMGDPFADMDLDLSAAGTTIADAQIFFEDLDPEQQQEVVSRCAQAEPAPVPEGQDPASEEAGMTLCRNLVEAGLVEGPAAR